MPSDRSRWRAWRGVASLGLIALALPGLGVLGLFEPLRSLAETIRGDGVVWWPAFIAGAALLCGFAVMPTHAISLAAGFMFGTALGAAGAVVAVAGGSAIGWAVARRLAGDRLRGAIERSRAGRALAAAMIDARGGRAVLAVTLARLPPQMPFALGNVAAAATGVRLAALLPGTALGMLPRVAAVAWLGSTLAELDAESDPTVLVVGVAAAGVGLLGLGGWSWRVLRRAGAKAAS